MTDESVLIGLVKLQLRKVKLGCLNLTEISDEEIMISNLPLLFADGYPTCLEKITLKQLEKFVPFMLQCSLGQNYLDRYTSVPKWWPADLPFSIFVEKPVGMDDTRWFSLLKSMVCRCYTYHGCEFMLRFCTELSKCPSTTYVFVESLDGTTSLYNKETGRLMVTFRNENREYDKEVESNLRRLLVQKNFSQNASHIRVQPPVYDIYLCDSCDGEFDSLTEVQEHEKTCGKHQISQEITPEKQPQQDSQDTFLCYFNLKPVNSKDVPRAVSPLKKSSCKRRYPVGVTFTRCCGVPFSSPLGIAIQKKSRMATVNPQVLLDRMERYCITKTEGPICRSREREFEDKVQEAIEWPVTWKPPHHKKAQDTWTHHYCFTVKESYERIARKSSGGLSKRSRKLLSMCRDVRVVLTRLTEDKIVELTARMPPQEPFPRDSETTFQLPTLLPNTMYAYNTSLNIKNHYPEPVALSPQATIPVIDLCSTDEEDEGSLDEVQHVRSVPLLSDENGPLILAGDKYLEQNENGIEEVEPMFCDKNSSPNITVYPLVETSCDSYTNTGRYPSGLDGGTFAVQYSSEPSLRFSQSIPHGWQMKICRKTPTSAPCAPAFTHEENHIYSSPLHCNSTGIPLPNLSRPERNERIQMNLNTITTSEETFDCDVVEEIHTPLLRRNATNCFKLRNPHVSLVRNRIDTHPKARLSVPSCTSTSLTSDLADSEKSISKFSFPHRKKLQVKVIGTTSDPPSSASESYVEAVTDSLKSCCSVSSLNHRKEQAIIKVGSTSSSAESFHHDQADAHVSLCEGKEKIQTSLLRISPNTSSPVFTPEESVSLSDDTMSTSASCHSVTTLSHRRVRCQRRLSNNTTTPSPSPVPTLHSVRKIASYASLQSDLTDCLKTHKSKLSVPLGREQSQSRVLMTPLPAPAPTFTQEGGGTVYAPLQCDSMSDPKSHHSNLTLPQRRERTRFATKRASKEPKPVEDIDSVVPDPKKPNLQLHRETIPGMESATQDTSNSDVFGVSVKHEKAAKSLQRCMTKHSSPLSLRRLYQDECRELRRRGLSEVMNISGRVLRGQLVDERVQPKIRLVAQLANMCGTNNCSQVKDPGNLLKQEEF